MCSQHRWPPDTCQNLRKLDDRANLKGISQANVTPWEDGQKSFSPLGMRTPNIGKHLALPYEGEKGPAAKPCTLSARRKDPQQSPAPFRIAVTDPEDPALQCRSPSVYMAGVYEQRDLKEGGQAGVLCRNMFNATWSLFGSRGKVVALEKLRIPSPGPKKWPGGEHRSLI